jgi:hypothetical protein
MNENPGKLPGEVIASAWTRVIGAVAEKDPRMAFRLGDELDRPPITFLHTIVTAATTNETRSVTLDALRGYLRAHKGDPAVSEHAARSFGYFSWGFKPDGFAAALEWLASENLTPEELENFCAGLSISSEVANPAEWIEWMGAELSPEKGGEQIVNLVSRWTRDDYLAAGKWLAAAPSGSAKTAAIRGYVQTIYQQDPHTAMQWIMSLPPGNDRDSSLKQIYQNWPKQDPAAREAFARQHGID